MQDPSFWSSNVVNGDLNDCSLNGASEQDNAVRHYSVNACLAPVASLHGMAVTTIEGIGSTRYDISLIRSIEKYKMYNFSCF